MLQKYYFFLNYARKLLKKCAREVGVGNYCYWRFVFNLMLSYILFQPPPLLLCILHTKGMKGFQLLRILLQTPHGSIFRRTNHEHLPLLLQFSNLLNTSIILIIPLLDSA